MGAFLPTLSLFGITDSPSVLMERLLLYFITSDYSQSVSFYGKIYSLKYLLAKYNQDDNGLIAAIDSDLTDFYSKYFEDVEVTVSVDSSLPEKKIELNISAVDSNGETHYLTDNIEVNNDNTVDLDNFLYRR